MGGCCAACRPRVAGVGLRLARHRREHFRAQSAHHCRAVHVARLLELPSCGSCTFKDVARPSIRRRVRTFISRRLLGLHRVEGSFLEQQVVCPSATVRIDCQQPTRVHPASDRGRQDGLRRLTNRLPEQSRKEITQRARQGPR